jgi:competence protein ComEC
MSASKILFFLCISFVFGVFLESVTEIPQIFIWGILILGFSFTIFGAVVSFWPRGKKLTRDILVIPGFCLLFLIIGVLRFQISEFNIKNDKLSKLNGKEKIVLSGTIYDDPDVRETFQKIKVKTGESIILITTKRYPEYNYLDKVKITGKLETPAEDFSAEGGSASGGSYKNYLMKDGIYSVMNFPKMEAVSQKHNHDFFSYFYEKILFCKHKIRDSIQRNFPPPQSSILEGTILGSNGAMTEDLKNKLNITGLRHVIAVSGTHVVILSSVIMSLLLAAGFARGRAFYLVIGLICIYIFLTGLPSSGVRAGIMGGLFLFAQKFGRQGTSSRIIVTACAVMVAINPLLLLYDVGFQLSFLAVMGLIYLEPFLKNLVKKITRDKADGLASIISATFAAQIFTLPVMIYNFGNISFVSPITNLLILPIVYWLMVSGFLVAIAGIFSNILGWILSVPCYFLLSYFLWVIDFFSKPWAMKTIENVHCLWLLGMYFIIALVVAYLNVFKAKSFE